MDRPYIICHMLTSIDGKVTGKFLQTEEAAKACDTYYCINRELKCDGFICGRVTMEESFTGGWYPDLNKYESLIHSTQTKTDYIPEDMTGFYAIAFDPKGKLGWKSNHIIDDDPGYDNARIIEVLTEQADSRYLAYLQAMDIPYIFAGKTEIDVELALYKLHNAAGIDKLLLEGGSVVNGHFLRAGVVDELSLVVVPVTAAKNDKPLFMDGEVSDFRLREFKEFDRGVLWLNYIAADLCK